jgi:hypothetical protein
MEEIKPIEESKTSSVNVGDTNEFDGLTEEQISQKFLEEHLKLQIRYKRTFDFQPQIRIVKMEQMK